MQFYQKGKKFFSILLVFTFMFILMVAPVSVNAQQAIQEAAGVSEDQNTSSETLITEQKALTKSKGNQQQKKTNRFIVKYKAEKPSEDITSKIEDEIHNVRSLKNKQLENRFQVIVTKNKMSREDLMEDIKNQNAESIIEYIEPDMEISLPPEAAVSEQETVVASVYGSEGIYGAPMGEDVIIAVIDTGMDITHVGLADNIWRNTGEIPGNGIDDGQNGYIDDVNGYNFYDDNNVVHNPSAMMDEQHATHIAGIIAAVDNNTGITGVASKAKIMPIKVFSNGTAYVSDIIEAISYAESMGAKVANMSWGGSENSMALKEAMAQSGMLFICAAGNYGTNNDIRPIYPASYNLNNILTVTSVSEAGELSSFSNYGPASVHVAAPGQNILSTMPANTYGRKSGTSMAAPYATGEAALLYTQNQSSTAQQVKEAIIKSADLLPALIGRIYSGRINCQNALVGVDNGIITGTGTIVTDTVYGKVYGSAFSTFSGSPLYSPVQTTDAAVFSVPQGSVNGAFKELKIIGNTESSGKSTSNLRIKSENINVFDKSKKPSLLNGATATELETGIKVQSDTSYIWTNVAYKQKLQPNTQYRISFDMNVISGVGFVEIFDNVNGNIRFIGSTSVNNVVFTTKSEEDVYFRFYATDGNATVGEVEYNNLIISKLDVTGYVSHEENVLYIGEELRSFPNGIKDEIRTDAGKLCRRIKQKLIQDDDIATIYTGNSSFEIAYINKPTDSIAYNQNNIWGWCTLEGFTNEQNSIYTVFSSYGTVVFGVTFPKGTTLQQARDYLRNRKLIYQLAQPKTIQLNIPPITCFENGTIIIDRAVKEISVYSAGITVPVDNPPIEQLESVYKIDGSAKIPVDLSSVHVSSMGMSFTIDGAQSGERYEYVYTYDSSLSTLPTVEFSVPMNTDAQIDGNTQMIGQHSEIIDYLLKRIESLEQEIKKLSPGSVVNYEYDDNGALIRRIVQ
ncbi:S8 family peptidase [Petroclostridium sp. X23]|uniref:S8 family peptidase n=1 Tax=Petroclostridium sp. X23 TaxID=3045146 RepID=UPI0024ADD64B|nr:S8 family peptidase [Petroclostridium sp. X23]WHH58411.1 S8 family peptidase [Petroclostridium sp. X23]